RDSLAGVGDADFDSIGASPQADLDASILRREFHGVGEQVPDDLLEAVRVGLHHSDVFAVVFLDAHAARVGGGADRVAGGAGNFDKIGLAHVEAQLAGADARGVEQILD